MRVDSPSMLKGKSRVANADRRPRPGSKTRAIYDMFAAAPGAPVSLSYAYNQIRDLMDFYGMDIRRVGNGRYLLAGEWDGLHYRDFVAERMEREGNV